MRSIKLFLAVLFSLSVTACGGGGGSDSPAPAPTSSEGTAGAPLTISTIPYNGQVDGANDSFYAYSATGTIQTITATNLTGDIDLKVFTDSTFTTQSTNWTCTTNLGTTADTCTATTPVPAGTVLYISAWEYTSAGATYTLSVTTTNIPVTGAEGAAGAPLTITMPHNGQVDNVNNSYYAYSATGTIQTITATNLTGDIDLKVFTDSSFTTQSTNWTCTTNLGTAADSCTAVTPVPAGTVLYISAWEYTSAGATYTLGVTTTSTPVTGSEGAAAAPLTITMPHNGQVDSVNDSFYAYTATGTIQTITATNLTDDIDLRVYTDSTFTTLSSNWSCPLKLGTTAETCTAATAAPPGTVLYIRAWNYTNVGGTYTLGVTTTSTTGSEGTAGAPLAISMPHNGQVTGSAGGWADSFYSHTAAGQVGTISLTNLTDDVDLKVYTDATFTVISTNWYCTVNLGTAADSCTAITPVPAGTVLYISAWNYTIAGGTYTLSVAP